MPTGDFMLRPKTFAYLLLSDTIPSEASHSAPGFRYPGEYKWNREVEAHILNGRLYDTENPLEREEYNKESMNACRAYHRHCYPVPVLVTKMVESGFDEPQAVTIVVPAGEQIPDGAQDIRPAPPAEETQPEPQPLPGPPATAQARKKAQLLGVDLEQLRGRGSGSGGIINAEDVLNYWRTEGRKDEGPVEAGPVRMSEVLGGVQP